MIYGSSQILYFLLAVAAQSALAVIGNIALSLSKNKGKIINSPFTGDEFTQAQKLPTSDVRDVFPKLSQTALIELIFGGV